MYVVVRYSQTCFFYLLGYMVNHLRLNTFYHFYNASKIQRLGFVSKQVSGYALELYVRYINTDSMAVFTSELYLLLCRKKVPHAKPREPGSIDPH